MIRIKMSNKKYKQSVNFISKISQLYATQIPDSNLNSPILQPVIS